MPERQFLDSRPANPDPSADTYILVSITQNSEKEQFNTILQTTRTVMVSGVDLIIDQNTSTNQLFAEFNGATDIKAMTLAADRVIISSPWLLPATNLTTFARELAFTGDGRIVTTAKDWDIHADDSQNAADPGNDGQTGESTGSITLNVLHPGRR